VLSSRYSCRILTKLSPSGHIFEKSSDIRFHENPSSGNRLVPCGQTDGRTDKTKLIIVFRSFANPPKQQLTILYTVCRHTKTAVECSSFDLATSLRLRQMDSLSETGYKNISVHTTGTDVCHQSPSVLYQAVTQYFISGVMKNV
jgi:hypothetical protein